MSDYVWCLHCERCYKIGEHRVVEAPRLAQVMGITEFELCYYEDCDGSADIDAWSWERIRESHPKYPEIPVEGEVYPQY